MSAATQELPASASRHWLGAGREAAAEVVPLHCAATGALTPAPPPLAHAVWKSGSGVSATASSQFWMPPEDPWRWTRGALPASPPPPPLPPTQPHAHAHAHAHGRDADRHCCCHGHSGHSNSKNDWMNVRKDSLYYPEPTPPREPLMPATGRHHETSERISRSHREPKKHSTHIEDKEYEIREGDPAASAPPPLPSPTVPAQPAPPSPRRSPPPKRHVRSHVHYRREGTYVKADERGTRGAGDTGEGEDKRAGGDGGGGGGGGGGGDGDGDGGY